MKRRLRRLYVLLKALAADPHGFAQAATIMFSISSAHRFSRAYDDASSHDSVTSVSASANPLWDYFKNHRDGHGIWKWEHYFDIYHRHLARFVGRKVNILEIGIYSGGSLEMWRSYFGENSHIYGVDIEEVCKVYESEHVSVIIGDQASREFWSNFRKNVEGIDIIIDDGGHTPEQQQTTLEEMLPYLRPGGVYICEDVHSPFNRFAAYATGLVNELNGMNLIPGDLLQSSVSPFQSSIHSIHFYPYVVVIEKRRASLAKLSAPKHGTEWQRFNT